MNCPRCGKKRTVTKQDLLIGLLVECGARTSHKFDYCCCSKDVPVPKFISGNWLTQSRAEQKGNLWGDIWHTHNLPEMRDCRDLNYKYAVVNNRIICEATGDYYDITDEVVSQVT